ncbi:Transcription factor, fungi [Penicillium italicum]|uniref:Transcription factor, fungi n=1 Tax=Penicillium italicum TaxID=40296 RepID=A0A0A2L8E1_PENIT|nr:Transcription factor, fungi [Penicillium italicum]
MERIVSFFVSVTKDGQRKHKGHHDSTWSHKKEFLWAMRQDLNEYMASFSDHGEQTLLEPELNHVWFQAANKEMDRRGAIPHTVEDSEVHVLHGSGAEHTTTDFKLLETSDCYTLIPKFHWKIRSQDVCVRFMSYSEGITIHLSHFMLEHTKAHLKSLLETLSQRLAKLEESSNKETQYFPTRHHAASSTSSSPSANLTSITEVLNDKQKRYRAYDPHDTATLQRPPSKHRKSETVAQKNVHQEHSPGSTHHASEAMEYIEHELQCNPALSKDRRTALESARKFVGQLSNPTLNFEETAAVPEMDVQENLEPPTLTPELLFMMIPGPGKKTDCQETITWPDHISDKVLEQMGLAIIEGTECEQVLRHYRINVWVKAMGCISKMAPLITSEPLRNHFRSLRKSYEVAAIEALNQIPLAAEPSLILLQSVMSASRLMRYLGNMTRSWMLTALASRMIVSLNYHNITDASPRTEIEESIHACVYTCYYFDKTLSLLLLRPPSLPDLKVKPTQLIHIDPDLPTYAIMTGIVEYSELKSTLLNILLDGKTIGDTEKANKLSDLVARAHKIYSNTQMFRRRQEQQFPQSWSHLRRVWLSIDFNYYSVLTTIIQARSSVLKSRLVCEDCLYTAREALTTLRALQEACSSRINSIDPYPHFLTWTMLLFPLAPFFVLFCNVIATSDERDFNMIKNITDELHQFAEANASIARLCKLFSKFLDLCAPLVKGNPEHSHSEQPATALADADKAGNTEDQTVSHANMFSRAADPDQALVALGGTDTIEGEPSAPPSMEGWDDSLVWELFNNQPSLGWAESELWNAMPQFDA